MFRKLQIIEYRRNENRRKNVYKYFYNLELTKTSYFWYQDTISGSRERKGSI